MASQIDNKIIKRGRGGRGGIIGNASDMTDRVFDGTFNFGGSHFKMPSNDPIGALEAFTANEIGAVQQSPMADSLARLATPTPDQVRSAAKKARGEADTAADVAEGIFSRRTEGFALTERQKKAAKNTFSLNRALTVADAGTSARRGLSSQARAAAAGGGVFSDIAFGQQLAALSGLANADGQRQVRESAERAQGKRDRNSMIGTIAGLGIGLLSLSSEQAKTPTETAPSLLDKLKKVRVDRWKYHGGDRDHIGPYAEEFNETFGVGKNHQSYLDVVDVLGVTLGSIKELSQKVEALG
jgi:hypothetical protein